MGLRITTWNVNGIRNPFAYPPWREKRSFQAMFDILEADIVIIQETKIQRKDLQDDMVLVPGWDVFFSLPKHKKGYSGVAIYTRNSKCAPIRAEEGIMGVLCPAKSTTMFRDLPEDQQIGGYPRPEQLNGPLDEITLDSEGRCVILEFPAFVLLGVYSPANRDESRDDFRTGFFEALEVRIRNMVAAGKQVILTGDLNVVRSELDTSVNVESPQKDGMTFEEWRSLPVRRIFNQLIFEGDVRGPRDEGREKPVLWDLCRCFHPDRKGMNTCWDTKKNTRPANYGSRIDYILCSDGIKDWFTFCDIQEGLMGSDHCPVYATLAEQVPAADGEVPLLDLVNPAGMYQNGNRKRELGSKDLLPLSARLIPEFDRRQSIRDMFTKTPRPSLSKQTSSITCESAKATHAQSTGVGRSSQDANGNNNTSSQATDGVDTTVKMTPASALPTTAKRIARSPAAPNRAPKKNRVSNEAGAGARNKAVPGQRTLQGFFKPKATTSKTEEAKPSANLDRESTPPPQPSPSASSPATPAYAASLREDGDSQASPLQVGSSITSPEKVFDPIEAKESWSKLLGKRTVPRCEHNEPCISLVTKKAGVNCGRSFYICPRPLGPSGEKEKNSEWRCSTFIWSSDWNGGSS